MLKCKFESSSPVKINKFQLKKNLKTEKEELILNKRTKIEDPHESAMDFDLQQVDVDAETLQSIDSSVEEIQQRENNTLVNIAGPISFNGTAETVNVHGKTVTKQETLFTDNSGSLHLVLWEQDTKKNEIWPVLQHIKCCH